MIINSDPISPGRIMPGGERYKSVIFPVPLVHMLVSTCPAISLNAGVHIIRLSQWFPCVPVILSPFFWGALPRFLVRREPNVGMDVRGRFEISSIFV